MEELKVKALLVGARVDPAHIEQLMASLSFHVTRVTASTTMLAAAMLPDGFVVAVGRSDCLDPTVFDFAIGERIAREDAVRLARAKLWELEGYLVRDRQAAVTVSGQRLDACSSEFQLPQKACDVGRPGGCEACE